MSRDLLFSAWGEEGGLGESLSRNQPKQTHGAQQRTAQPGPREHGGPQKRNPALPFCHCKGTVNKVAAFHLGLALRSCSVSSQSGGKQAARSPRVPSRFTANTFLGQNAAAAAALSSGRREREGFSAIGPAEEAFARDAALLCPPGKEEEEEAGALPASLPNRLCLSLSSPATQETPST